MANQEIAALRMANQRISGDRFDRPEEVVRWMGAVQAQEYQHALWAVGLRTKSATAEDVEQAIADGKIVRTWPMRGTLHFVPAEDAKWMVKLSAPRLVAGAKRRLEQLELDEHILDRCKMLFYDALKGGRRLPRPEMLKLLEDAGISTRNQRGYHILWRASQDGLLCIGPRQGKQQTFVLLDEWVPNSKELSREESLAELAGHYFVSHGPATLQDFAGWAGLTVSEARVGLESIKQELISRTIDGKEYWMTGASPNRGAHDPVGAYLLPAFDEYLIGYKDRSAVLTGDGMQSIIPYSNGMFLPVILYEGLVTGTWQWTIKKQAVEVALRPFVPQDDLKESAAAALERFSRFVNLPYTLN